MAGVKVGGDFSKSGVGGSMADMEPRGAGRIFSVAAMRRERPRARAILRGMVVRATRRGKGRMCVTSQARRGLRIVLCGVVELLRGPPPSEADAGLRTAAAIWGRTASRMS